MRDLSPASFLGSVTPAASAINIRDAVRPDANRTALINVEMQNFFAEGYEFSAPDGLIIQERINRISAACRKVGIPVIHTRHLFRPDEKKVGTLGQFYPAAKGLLAEGSEAAQLHPKLGRHLYSVRRRRKQAQ